MIAVFFLGFGTGVLAMIGAVVVYVIVTPNAQSLPPARTRQIRRAARAGRLRLPPDGVRQPITTIRSEDP